MTDEDLQVSMEEHVRRVIRLAQVWKFPMDAEFHIGSSDLLGAANYLERLVKATVEQTAGLVRQAHAAKTETVETIAKELSDSAYETTTFDHFREMIVDRKILARLDTALAAPISLQSKPEGPDSSPADES